MNEEKEVWNTPNEKNKVIVPKGTFNEIYNDCEDCEVDI